MNRVRRKVGSEFSILRVLSTTAQNLMPFWVGFDESVSKVYCIHVKWILKCNLHKGVKDCNSYFGAISLICCRIYANCSYVIFNTANRSKGLEECRRSKKKFFEKNILIDLFGTTENMTTYLFIYKNLNII